MENKFIELTEVNPSTGEENRVIIGLSNIALIQPTDTGSKIGLNFSAKESYVKQFQLLKTLIK